MYSECCVFTFALRTCPFESGSVLETRAINHWNLGVLSSFSKTMSPFCKLRSDLFHLLRCCKVSRYSFFQRLQKRLARYWIRRQRLRTYIYWNWPGGAKTIGFMVRIWLGVSGSKSSGLLDADVRGLEFTIDSTSHKSVRSDSSSKRHPWSWSNDARTFRMVRICRSHTPPMWLAVGGLNFHLIL